MSAKAIIDAINGAAAGVTASLVHDGGRDSIKITSNGKTGTAGSLVITGTATAILGLPASAAGASADIGFGSNAVSFAGATAGNAKDNVVNAGGSSQTGDLGFTPLAYGSDSQTITVTANDADGSTHYATINLANSGSIRNARTIDEAIEAINTALQQTNNPTLEKITAVKDNSSGTEKINFVSALASFQVSLGSTASGNGVTDSTGNQGTTLNSSGIDGGTSVDISTQQGGTDAISAITNAVSALGAAQANVGKAQNTLNYAIGLAESQMSNLAAAESRIRDADMAAEAANLTKAQVLQQSAIAAMVQANSAPQAVLTLLRG
jgi:flagellin